MSETTPEAASDAEDQEIRKTSGNQAKTEPMPPSPVATAPDFAEPSADRQPPPVEVPPLASEPPVPSPGNLPDDQGHIAVSNKAAQGTSEQLNAAEGVSQTAVAQAGKPDGEVAT